MKFLFSLALVGLIALSAASTLNLNCLNNGEGLYARYFDNTDFTALVKTDFNMGFFVDSGLGKLTSEMSAVDTFSAGWSGTFTPSQSGIYSFRARSDDGFRLLLDGVKVAGLFKIQIFSVSTSTSPSIYMDANQPYLFSIEYYDQNGHSQISLQYNFDGGAFQNFTLSQFKPCNLIPRQATTGNCATASQGLIADIYNKNDFTQFAKSISVSPGRWHNIGGIANAFVTNTSDFSVIFKGSFTYATDDTLIFYFPDDEQINLYIDNVPVLINTDTENLTLNQRKSTPFVVSAGKLYSFEARWTANPYKTSHSLGFKVHTFSGNTHVDTFNANYRACVPPKVVAPLRSSMSTLSAAKVPVVLSTQPTSTVTVAVLSPSGLNASPCTLTFTTSNWNVPQYVYARNGAGSTGQTLSFTPTSSDANYNTGSAGTTTQIYGTPTSCTNSFVPGATCSSWGDPHLVTFDAKKYDVHTFEDMYLIRHITSEFIVQTRQSPCGGGAVACNFAVAIKYQDALIRIFISGKTGVPTLFVNTAAKNNGGISITLTGVNYLITLPSSISIQVKSEWWNGGKTYYMSIYVTVPTSYQDRVRGLCGIYNGDANNDFHLVDGSTASSESEHINAWIVPSGENLINNDISIPALGTVSDTPCPTSQCVPPPPLPPVCVGAECNIVPPPPVPTCTYTLSQAEADCDVFKNSDYAKECAKLGVDINSWFDQCVEEAVEMCGSDSVPSQACSFQIACQLAPVPQCPCLCNLQGTCVEDGKCVCAGAITGDNCDNDPNSVPCSIAVNPPSGKVGTNVVVNVAQLPLGAILQCLINGKSSEATYVSATSVSCKIPDAISPGTYSVRVLANGEGDDCGATFTVSGGGLLDPHFAGFNGERMEVKRDSDAANQLFHIYCSESITITALFYEYEDKLLFMTKFWVRLGETLFTLNLSPKPKILTSHEEPVYMEELGRYRVEIPDGHLEWDDNKLRVTYKYLKINFSTHVYLQGSPYMNIDFTITNSKLESPVTGIVGRTLHNTLSTEEFESYLQFKAPVSDVITFQCSVPNNTI